MGDEKTASIDWDHFTDNHAAILEAYFALFQARDPATIGSGEIVKWLRDRKRTPPSEALIRTVLADVAAPRRAGGRPSNESREITPRSDSATDDGESPPLSAIRTTSPRPRRSPPK